MLRHIKEESSHLEALEINAVVHSYIGHRKPKLQDYFIYSSKHQHIIMILTCPQTGASQQGQKNLALLFLWASETHFYRKQEYTSLFKLLKFKIVCCIIDQSYIFKT